MGHTWDMARREQAHTAVARLFRRQPVADLTTLQRVIGTTSRRTVFRTLSDVGYVTSYSHAGRYYTLESIPRFNEEGVWAHQGVLFSQYRTLRATIVQQVADAEAGRTHVELQARLRLRVHDAVRQLTQAKRIGRVVIARLFLYVSVDTTIADAQQAKRRQLLEAQPPPVLLPSLTVIIEVLLDVIQDAHAQADPRAVAARLEARGVVVTPAQVEEVFRHHGLEKKTVGSPSPRSRR